MGPFELWDSPVAYLFTYVSHKFVARTRHDKTLVDEINIERTVVGDCPRQRKRALVEAKTESVCGKVDIQIDESESEHQCKANATNPTNDITKGDIVESGLGKNTTAASFGANVPIDPKKTVKGHKDANVIKAGSP